MRLVASTAALALAALPAFAGHPSPVPALAVGGERGMGDAVASNLRPLFADVRGAVVPAAGHFLPEERPAEVARLLLDFFAAE